MKKSTGRDKNKKIPLYTTITSGAANAIKNNAIKVTVLSAATVVTFAGGVLILPRSVSADSLKDVSNTVNYSDVREKVKDAVVSGLSEDEYQEIFEKFSKEGMHLRSKRMGMWKFNPLISEYLGLSRTEIAEQFRGGKNLREIAEDQGADFDELQEILRDQLQERIREREGEGRNSVRSKRILERMDSIVQP